MWQFLLRQFLQQAARQPLKQVGKTLAGTLFSKEANGPEAFADRIKRDFHLQDYSDAWSRYASDPAYWERWYAPPPKPDWRTENVHDSVMAAGIPSRYNVFEYGYPESPGQPASTNSVPPNGGPPDPNQIVNDRFGKWGSSPAIVAPPTAAGASDSFNDRFGKWGSAPVDRFNDPGSPVLRELRNLRRSAVPEAPNPLPSIDTASLPSPPPSPVAPDGPDVDFDVSGMPMWMRNALADRPRNGSAVIASADDDAAPEDSRNVRVLGARLARY